MFAASGPLFGEVVGTTAKVSTTVQELIEKTDAWERARNGATAKIDWPFTTADARIRLRRLYPKL